MSTFDTTTHTPDASIWPTAIKWGVISGIVGSVLTMVFYNIGLSEPGNTSGSVISFLLTLGISFVFVFLGTKDYKENDNAGQLSLGRGVLWSLGIGLIAGLITMLFNYIFFTYLAPDVIQEVLNLEIAKMEEDGLGEEDIEAALPFIEPFMSPISFAIFGAIGSIAISLIEGLVASLILKTR